MADIPVERQSTGNWWKWLLGLALLALAIWLIAGLIDPGAGELDEDVEDPIEQPGEQPTGEASPGDADGAITSLAAVTTTTGNQDDVAGRDVQFANLNVTSVVGDGTFYVSTNNANEQVLVVLDEATQVEGAAAGADGQVNVSEGQTISLLEGAVEQMEDAALSERGLDNTRAAGEQQFYIQAERINIGTTG